jgi:hypothetical protein
VLFGDNEMVFHEAHAKNCAKPANVYPPFVNSLASPEKSLAFLLKFLYFY